MKSITYRLPLVLWCLVALFLLTAFTSIKIFAYSSGPPDGRTGSPADGFQTCNDIGCHNSYPLNSGSAAFSISAPSTYTLGEVLSITVSFSNSSTAKHGFELSALDASNNHVGTFNGVDGDGNTQTSNGDYIKHTSAGSSQSGNASWNVQWTSPTSEVQNPVTFYAAGNEANGDSTNQGDYIYTTTIQISSVVSTPTTTPSATPVVTPTQTPSTSVTPQLAAGRYHSIVMKSDGTVWTWGKNHSGQLGYNIGQQKIPKQVDKIDNIKVIASGADHNLALKSDGTLWSWGSNSYGQLGDGDSYYSDSKDPREVSNLGKVISVSGGYHSLALKEDGTVWAWGYNYSGQLGDGTNTNRDKPIQVKELSNIIAIAAGSYHSLAVKSDGTVWAWGRNDNGQLGNSSYIESNIPVKVNDLDDIVDVAGGVVSSMALKSNGTVWGWGDNRFGQLGDGTYTDRTIPVLVSELNNVSSIACGGYHSIALKDDNAIWAWGYNYYGQLGDGTTSNKNTPNKVVDLNKIIAIKAGTIHTIALKTDGTVWTWGYNGDGQLGNGESGTGDLDSPLRETVPVQVDINLYASTSTTPTPTTTPTALPTFSPIPSPSVSPTPIPSLTPSSSIIFGFVDDEEEYALEGVTVTLDGAAHSESLETDKEGFYGFRNLLAGDYTLTYEKDGFQTYTESISLLDGEIKEIRTITLEKVVPTPTPSPTPLSSNIFGFVYDSEEEPIQDVTVTIKGDNYSGSTSTDEYGYYELKNLSSGDYTLTYNKEGYQTKTKDITLEEKENLDLGIITLELVEKGSIFGYVMDFRGYEIDSATIRMKGLNTGYSKTISSDTDGYFEFTDLEADTYILTAKKSGYKQGKRTVKLSEGEAREVELKMKRRKKTSVQSQF